MSKRLLCFRVAALVSALGLGTLPMGCGSTEEYAQVREPTPDNPLPESTRVRVQECADTYADALQLRNSSVRFDLKMTSTGHIRGVQPIGARLESRDMEICMIQALQAITVPRFIVEKAQSELKPNTTSGDNRGYCGRIMGYLFTEIVAPIQSEHTELAPPGFESMEAEELPTLKLTKGKQGELLEMLNQIYTHVGGMADIVRERCDNVETALYRGRIHQVLVHVSEAMVCVLAAHIAPE
jgi:hypothetical protein